MGYVVISVQILGILSHDEDQVALVIWDMSSLGNHILVIIGMPTINRVIWSMKESEMQSAPHEWQLARVACEMADRFYSFQANCTEEGMMTMPTNTMKDPLDIDEKVLLNEKCKIPGF